MLEKNKFYSDEELNIVVKKYFINLYNKISTLGSGGIDLYIEIDNFIYKHIHKKHISFLEEYLFCNTINNKLLEIADNQNLFLFKNYRGKTINHLKTIYLDLLDLDDIINYCLYNKCPSNDFPYYLLDNEESILNPRIIVEECLNICSRIPNNYVICFFDSEPKNIFNPNNIYVKYENVLLNNYLKSIYLNIIDTMEAMTVGLSYGLYFYINDHLLENKNISDVLNFIGKLKIIDNLINNFHEFCQIKLENHYKRNYKFDI